jgi:hypothetical protein
MCMHFKLGLNEANQLSTLNTKKNYHVTCLNSSVVEFLSSSALFSFCWASLHFFTAASFLLSNRCRSAFNASIAFASDTSFPIRTNGPAIGSKSQRNFFGSSRSRWAFRKRSSATESRFSSSRRSSRRDCSSRSAISNWLWRSFSLQATIVTSFKLHLKFEINQNRIQKKGNN